ncbi:MAG: immunoglobulin domain-containing protein, partial [Oscillochloris sp.]|nr:immunoglobulin domain-containing protein [Oscillochloris sp.]
MHCSRCSHRSWPIRLAALCALLVATLVGPFAVPQRALAAATAFAQWTFNSPTPDSATSTGTSSPATGSGTLTMVGGATNPSFNSGSGSADPAASDNSGFQTTTYPAQGSGNETAGIQFNVSTAGQQNIVVSWDQRHSNTSSRYVRFQYSTDGTTFTNLGTLFEANAGDTWFNTRSVDLSAITGVNDNPSFAFRIVAAFAPGTSAYAASNSAKTYGSDGTWRFDMVTVSGEPAGPTLIAPSITAQPTSVTISAGATASLTVAASGSSPLSYQWYQGSVGDTSAPVGTDSASFTSPALSASTSYWVRVRNSVGSVDSSAATVTLLAACAASDTPIGTVQGSSDITPFAGQTVTIQGVVVGDYELPAGSNQIR